MAEKPFYPYSRWKPGRSDSPFQSDQSTLDWRSETKDRICSLPYRSMIRDPSLSEGLKSSSCLGGSQTKAHRRQRKQKLDHQERGHRKLALDKSLSIFLTLLTTVLGTGMKRGWSADFDSIRLPFPLNARLSYWYRNRSLWGTSSVSWSPLDTYRSIRNGH